MEALALTKPVSDPKQQSGTGTAQMSLLVVVATKVEGTVPVEGLLDTVRAGLGLAELGLDHEIRSYVQPKPPPPRTGYGRQQAATAEAHTDLVAGASVWGVGWG